MAFTPELLDLLRAAQYDPLAQRHYDGLSGALRWTDEFPNEFIDEAMRLGNWSFRDLLAYRASLTRERPEMRHQSIWYQVLRACPDWPGFRIERHAKQLAEILDSEQERFLAGVDALFD